MKGYSKRSLTEKLGIKPNSRVCFIHAPGYLASLIAPLPSNVTVLKVPTRPLDFIHFFTHSRAELEDWLPKLKADLAYDGMLWISWPKVKLKLPADLNENTIRTLGLEIGLVDVKVVAIDDIWSGLKFVYRLKDRKSTTTG